MQKDTGEDREREVRIGHFVAPRTEGTPAPWHQSVHSGEGQELIRNVARVLNGTRGAEEEGAE